MFHSHGNYPCSITCSADFLIFHIGTKIQIQILYWFRNPMIGHLHVFLIYFLEYVTLLDSWHERLMNGNLGWILLTKTSYV
jgi:hypothetical protein